MSRKGRPQRGQKGESEFPEITSSSSAHFPKAKNGKHLSPLPSTLPSSGRLCSHQGGDRITPPRLLPFLPCPARVWLGPAAWAPPHCPEAILLPRPPKYPVSGFQARATTPSWPLSSCKTRSGFLCGPQGQSPLEDKAPGLRACPVQLSYTQRLCKCAKGASPRVQSTSKHIPGGEEGGRQARGHGSDPPAAPARC